MLSKTEKQQFEQLKSRVKRGEKERQLLLDRLSSFETIIRNLIEGIKNANHPSQDQDSTQPVQIQSEEAETNEGDN